MCVCVDFKWLNRMSSDGGELVMVKMTGESVGAPERKFPAAQTKYTQILFDRIVHATIALHIFTLCVDEAKDSSRQTHTAHRSSKHMKNEMN